MLASSMNSSIRLKEGRRKREEETKKGRVDGIILLHNTGKLGTPVALLVLIDVAAIRQPRLGVQGERKLILHKMTTKPMKT